MCGIVFGKSKRKQKIFKALMRRYKDQKTRGREGYGYVAMYPDGISYVRRETEREIEEELRKETSDTVMFHHRFPTSTINVEECAHPIKVSHDELDYDYYVVHNGVIRNSDELKKKHESYPTPYKYTTVLSNEDKTVHKSALSGREYYTGGSKPYEEYNDTEAVAIELARCIDGMTKTIDATGSMALVAYQVDKETNIVNKIFFCRNESSPLGIENNNDYIWIKSQGGKSLDPHKLYSLDPKTNEITERDQYVGREYPTHSHSNVHSRGDRFFTDEYEKYHGDKNTVKRLGDGKDEVEDKTLIRSPYQLGDDIDYDDPSEHDYKRSGKMGFRYKKEEDGVTGRQLNQDWNGNIDTTGLSNNDDVPYDVIFADERVRDMIEKTLRLQRLRYQYEYAVDECTRLIQNEKDDKDVVDWEDAREEAQVELDRVDQRMLEIEAEFYSMEDIHNGIEYYELIDVYREGLSDDEVDILLGMDIAKDGKKF